MPVHESCFEDPQKRGVKKVLKKHFGLKNSMFILKWEFWIPETPVF